MTVTPADIGFETVKATARGPTSQSERFDARTWPRCKGPSVRRSATREGGGENRHLAHGRSS